MHYINYIIASVSVNMSTFPEKNIFFPLKIEKGRFEVCFFPSSVLTVIIQRCMNRDNLGTEINICYKANTI